MPLPMSTMARDRIPASTWRGLAPSAARSPISRVRRETLTDTSEKIPSADRNKTSAVTPASAPTVTVKPSSRRRTHSSSGRASWTSNLASTSAAMTGRRAASGAGLPRTRTLITSGDTVPPTPRETHTAVRRPSRQGPGRSRARRRRSRTTGPRFISGVTSAADASDRADDAEYRRRAPIGDPRPALS